MDYTGENEGIQAPWSETHFRNSVNWQMFLPITFLFMRLDDLQITYCEKGYHELYEAIYIIIVYHKQTKKTKRRKKPNEING